MANEPTPPKRGEDTEETKLLREEVTRRRGEEDARDAKEAVAEQLKNRVALAAIVLTTALSFIGNIRGNRADAIAEHNAASTQARQQAAELWAYYQTKLAERTSLELAHDRLRLDLKKRGLSRDDPSIKLEALKLTEYEERVHDFDADTQQVFYRVQDLEKQDDVEQRQVVEPARAVERYELASKLITLALILLSVTILSTRVWLFFAGLGLGAVGVLLAFDAYLLFF